MERVCDPMLCGPPGGGVQRPGFGPGPSGSETKRRPYEALLHSGLWRHLPHDECRFQLPLLLAVHDCSAHTFLGGWKCLHSGLPILDQWTAPKVSR